MTNERVNVISFKWGTRYGADYVNRLQNSVQRHLTRPHRFVCFTDDPTGIQPSVETLPLPEIDLPMPAAVNGWRKISLFRNDLPLDGLTLFLDLDLVLTGSLDDFFTFGEPTDIPIIHNWVQRHKTIFRADPLIGNSSVFRFQANQCKFVWDQFHKEKDWALANFSPPQSYLTHCIRPRMKFWPDEWVRSFKRHCRPPFPFNWLLSPSLPPQARIIAFHGKPDPDEAAVGYRGSRLNHYSRPALWITDHWR